jgi:hypothetical protein
VSDELGSGDSGPTRLRLYRQHVIEPCAGKLLSSDGTVYFQSIEFRTENWAFRLTGRAKALVSLVGIPIATALLLAAYSLRPRVATVNKIDTETYLFNSFNGPEGDR